MSKYGLSNRLEISVEEAEQFIYEYFATYPKIQNYMHDTIEAATKNGYVSTMKGRIRYMPQIHSSNRQLREFAERTSINTPIQGSAADLIKMAMINIDHKLAEKMTDEEAQDAMDTCPVGSILKKERGYVEPIGSRKYDQQPIGSDIEQTVNK